ncbi:WRKY transcription factor [Ancistrocladus abbreviatus]
MDSYPGCGDLTDVIRASTGAVMAAGSSLSEEQMLFDARNLQQFAGNIMIGCSDFGDPFSDGRDPLLHDDGIGDGDHTISSRLFFCTSSTNMAANPSSSSNISVEKTSTCSDYHQDVKVNLLSTMLQISTPNEVGGGGGGGGGTSGPVACDSVPMPVPLPTAPVLAAASPRGDINVSAGSSTNYNTGVQNSSPRNPAIKRRKSQAKKVVCIPAPATVSSVQGGGGEVVPSDLWAWRKYGQKPIKGSPYPRGYYRCSSSKGCSARKQVERSRTDPNMLVITYTSEHNHPWPTQRNSLAGSTRSHHPSKLTAKSSSSSSSPNHTKAQTIKEDHDHKEEANNTAGTANGAYTSSINDHQEETNKNTDEKQTETGDDQLNHEGHFDDDHHGSETYRPAAMPHVNDQDFFFAELGDLLFSSEDNKDAKYYDPFTGLFEDWVAGNNGNPSS